jgi:hypothetical protein
MKSRIKIIGVIVCLALICSMTLTSVGALAQSGTWTTKASIPTARHGSAVGVINGKIYVAAGCCSQFVPPFERFENLEVYDPGSNTWETKAPIPLPIYAGVPGVLDGKLYVAGGQASQSVHGRPKRNYGGWRNRRKTLCCRWHESVEHISDYHTESV